MIYSIYTGVQGFFKPSYNSNLLWAVCLKMFMTSLWFTGMSLSTQSSIKIYLKKNVFFNGFLAILFGFIS